MSRPSTPSRGEHLEVSLQSKWKRARSQPRLKATLPADPPSNPEIFVTSATPSKPPPPPPLTPLRGRNGSRYPAYLSRGDPGRVPLHRRGKSRTYERLEDLLREAGYKETRIFTPETERTESYGPLGRGGSVRGGVGAVVDFLAGWMPGAGKADVHGAGEDANEDCNNPSPPPSPLAGKRQRPLSPLRIESIDNLSDISSPMGSPRMHHTRLPRLSLSREPNRFPSAASESLRAYAAAQGYLRHMASAPNIPKASASNDRTLVQQRYFSTRDKLAPPMPSNWQDAVTRAVRQTTDSELHVGGPRPSSRHSNRPGHSGKENHSVLCGYTIKSRPAGYLRSQTAPGEVTAVRVVCRSAPASRSSSRIGHRLSSVAGKTRAPRRKATDDVPTLASNRLENDVWGHQWVDGRRVTSSGSENNTDVSDDDDDDEIDLARLLVPPKRQKSIRSLRQHLHRSESARALRGSSLRNCEPWTDDDDSGKYSSDTRGRTRRASNDEDSEDASRWIANGNHHPGAKKRRTIPGNWANAG